MLRIKKEREMKPMMNLRRPTLKPNSILLPLLFAAATACSSPSDPSDSIPEMLAGGSMTVFNESLDAYSSPGPALSGSHLTDFLAGQQEFRVLRVASQDDEHGGLGPAYNAPACNSCHSYNGRGKPPLPGENSISVLAKLRMPGTDPTTGGALPVPGFGFQFNNYALPGLLPEGRIVATRVTDYAEETEDGVRISRPVIGFDLVDLYQPLPAGAIKAIRVPPPLFGLGLLLAVDESTILAMADETDADGDGISGRPNYVWDGLNEETRLGRLGWKAGTANLRQLVAVAFNDDFGVTNPWYPVENTAGTPLDDGLADDPEVGEAPILLVESYLRTVGVPAPRSLDDPQVQRGRVVFEEALCSKCHVPELRTGTVPGYPELSDQRIFPYTDLLLHDMGFELSDGFPEYEATTKEWRTPPLWGIGLSLTVNGHTHFLHDGRAADLDQAIAWHGGEGDLSKVKFLALSRTDREALMAFLRSL